MTFTTFVINLDDRTDRLNRMSGLLRGYNFIFNRFSAYRSPNGQEGIAASLQAVCLHCLENDIENVLIFEDDVQMHLPPGQFNVVLNRAITQLPSDFDALTLGANIEKPEWCSRYSGSLYRLSSFKALHAVLYSRSGMEKMLSIDKLPIDEHLPAGNYFITYPILCTQISGYSDIRGKRVSYDFMKGRYNKAIEYANQKVIT